MAKDTYMGIPTIKRFGGKPYYYHSRYATKRDAEKEAYFLRNSNKTYTGKRYSLRIVPINKANAKYAIYTRGK